MKDDIVIHGCSIEQPYTQKIQLYFVDHHAGFPVAIKNCPMIYTRGVWTPNINYNKLHDLIYEALKNKQELTENESDFIRHYEADK